MNIYLLTRTDDIIEGFINMVVIAESPQLAKRMHPDGGTLLKAPDNIKRKKSHWPKQAKYIECVLLGVSELECGIYCTDYAGE